MAPARTLARAATVRFDEASLLSPPTGVSAGAQTGSLTRQRAVLPSLGNAGARRHDDRLFDDELRAMAGAVTTYAMDSMPAISVDMLLAFVREHGGHGTNQRKQSSAPPCGVGSLAELIAHRQGEQRRRADSPGRRASPCGGSPTSLARGSTRQHTGGSTRLRLQTLSEHQAARHAALQLPARPHTAGTGGSEGGDGSDGGLAAGTDAGAGANRDGAGVKPSLGAGALPPVVPTGGARRADETCTAWDADVFRPLRLGAPTGPFGANVVHNAMVANVELLRRDPRQRAAFDAHVAELVERRREQARRPGALDAESIAKLRAERARRIDELRNAAASPKVGWRGDEASPFEDAAMAASVAARAIDAAAGPLLHLSARKRAQLLQAADDARAAMAEQRRAQLPVAAIAVALALGARCAAFAALIRAHQHATRRHVAHRKIVRAVRRHLIILTALTSGQRGQHQLRRNRAATNVVDHLIITRWSRLSMQVELIRRQLSFVRVHMAIQRKRRTASIIRASRVRPPCAGAERCARRPRPSRGPRVPRRGSRVTPRTTARAARDAGLSARAPRVDDRPGDV